MTIKFKSPSNIQKFNFLIVILLFQILILNLSVPVTIEAQNIDNEVNIIEQPISSDNKIKLIEIDKVDPSKPDKIDFKKSNGKIVSNSDGLKKEFDPLSGKIRLDNKKSKLEIETPNELNNPKITIQDNKIIYNSEDKKLDVIIENVDGGVRQVIVINDSDQPNRYQFPVKLQDGQYFKKI